MLDRLAVNLDAAHTPGMQQLDQFFFYCFQHDQEAGNLNAAACTSGTGTDKHQQDKDGAGKLRPQVKVCCGIAGCCNDGSNLENRLLECLCKAAEISAYIEGDRKRCGGDNQQIGTNLFTFPCLSEFTDQDQEVGVKVDAEQDHKDRDNDLTIGGIACNAVVFDAEAAGARRAEGERDGIKQRHAAKQQEENLNNCQDNVNHVQNFCSGFYLRNQTGNGGTRAFCLHQVHMAAACEGNQSQQKDQNTHTADPVRKAAPEQQTVRKRFHVCQNACTGCCKAGNGFKQRIDRIGNITGKYKGKCTDTA